MHELPLLVNIAVSLVVAFLGGVIARLIGLPTIVGYMLAGIAIGPFTPGFVGDVHTASQLAELGVIFLMFGVGVHFSLSAHGVPTLFGDAANSEVLSHAVLDQARMLVVTVPDEAAAELIVGAARVQAPTLPIIVRAATESGIKRLARLGARQVVHPELEGGLQIVRRTLLELGFPLSKVQEYEDVVRTDSYDLSINTSQERQLLQDLLRAGDNIGIAWLPVILWLATRGPRPIYGQCLALRSSPSCGQGR